MKKERKKIELIFLQKNGHLVRGHPRRFQMPGDFCTLTQNACVCDYKRAR